MEFTAGFLKTSRRKEEMHPSPLKNEVLLIHRPAERGHGHLLSLQGKGEMLSPHLTTFAERGGGGGSSSGFCFSSILENKSGIDIKAL